MAAAGVGPGHPNRQRSVALRAPFSPALAFLVIGLLALVSTVEALRLTRSAGDGIRPVRLPA
ncbi:hypothetical protein KPL76_05215 [Subtercola sp. PAMC28395]|uniref:hypothetical protein n=1 Tax=Subtercola sp. PAMC28395 TaxID=2846775 RepID=UPI001C0E489D|nr:hypothetical protein [Subtercola sp. PAMC28395]QWT24769.1 hypothetical protein KPL76_05215 [Subtercola sp. PAMC28395]